MRLTSLLAVAYLIVGVIVAANENYLGDINTIREIVSAILAIVLWPLVLLGVNVRIRG